MKRFCTGLLVFAMFSLLLINTFAYNFDNENEQTMFLFADQLYGKVFSKGKNEEVNRVEQLDTIITNVKVSNQNGEAQLEFDYAGEPIRIDSFLLESTLNNTDKNHYVFSPQNFNHNSFEIVVLKLTTCANEYDLMPVNYDLCEKTVLTIIMRDKALADVYYWQGELQYNTFIPSPLSVLNEETTIHTQALDMRAKNYNRIVHAANETYYKTGKSEQFSLSAEELENQAALLSTTKTTDTSGVSTMQAESNNPFYESDGIPNSVFQTPTNKWEQHVAWRKTVNNKAISMNYYTYSYQNYGDPNVYTLIMLLEFTEAKSQDKSTPTASKRLDIKVAANETVVYYTNYGTYDYGLGLNDLVDFYPTIEISKSGTAANHILTDRFFGGSGYKNPSVLSTVKQAASIFVGILDSSLSGGAITTSLSVLDLVYSATTTTSEKLGSSMQKFGDTVEDQLKNVGAIIGSVKVEMDGFIRSPENYFFVHAEFAANSSSVAAKNTWRLYYSID